MPSQHKQVFVFDMSRNRSHLFFRYLSTHPDVQGLPHPFSIAALFGPERITQYTKNVRVDGKDTEWAPPSGTNTYDEAISTLLHAAKKAEDQGKILVANEHAQLTYKQDIVLGLIRNQSVDIPILSNPTLIPDHIFTSLTPIFVIRHPVHATRSNYVNFREASQLRPGGEDWKLITGVPLQRRLFDHFRNRDNGKPPIVVDGDDVVWRTDELRDSLSRALNLDPKGLSSVWQAVPQDQRSKQAVFRHFLQTIDDSTGIKCPSEQRPDADPVKACQKWSDEYGQEVADQLRATLEQNMPHYEYMAQFKI